MKKFFAALISFVLLLPAVSFAVDLDVLQELTVQELTELKGEIESIIQEKRLFEATDEDELNAATRANPALVGQVCFHATESYSGDTTLAMSIVRSLRGDAASIVLKSFDRYNTQSSTIGKGNEWMLVMVHISAIETDGEKANISDYNFRFVSHDGAEYETSYIHNNPAEVRDLYLGAEQYAWVACKIKKGDTPLIVYNDFYDVSTWFNPNLRTVVDTSTIAYQPLDKNSSGAEVEDLQYRLMEVGMFPSLPNGKYGETTVNAVRKFQRLLGFEDTGIADEETLRAIYAGNLQ